MRIRKGHRCLPLAPVDSSLLQARCGGRGAGSDEAMVAVADIIGRRGRPQYQERAKDTSVERKKCLEYDLEKNRVSADDNFNACSLVIRDTGVDTTVTKLVETPSGERSLFTRHKPRDTTRTISSSTTSAIETRDQQDILEQSLRHVCARAGMSGLSARDAVAQIIEQDLPGLSEGGARLIDQVTKPFRNSSKFVECEEPGRYVLQDSLILEDSGISDKKTVSSGDMVEVAKQLQNMQKSRSLSLSSGVVDLSEAQSFDRHARNLKAVADISEEFAEFKGGKDYHQRASSSARFRSRKFMQIDQHVSRCKRDDGKGWRCSWPADDGYTMCTHHRKRSISQGQCRRKKGRFYPDFGTVSDLKRPSGNSSIYVANSRVLPDVVSAGASWSPFLDEELAHDEHRQFLKAKSIKSLLSKPPQNFSHIRRA